MGVHHGIRRQHRPARAVEQGQDRWAEGTVQAPGHLGTARPPADGGPYTRARPVQPWHRQQASRLQHKTQRPVQFEITPATRDALQAWIKHAGLKAEDYLFPSRSHESPHLGTRQYARILAPGSISSGWIARTTART